MRILLAMLLLAAAAPTAARADPSRGEVWLGGAARALRTPSANAVTDNNLGGASLGVARDLGLDLGPHLGLWIEGGLTIDEAQGTMFQTMSTEISTVGITAGLRARYQLHRLVALTAHAGLGPQRVELEVAYQLSDHRWGTQASAGGGLELFLRSRRRFAMGVRAEVGYVMTQAVELSPHRDTPGDVVALPITDLPIGRLDLSGPTAGLSVIAQF